MSQNNGNNGHRRPSRNGKGIVSYNHISARSLFRLPKEGTLASIVNGGLLVIDGSIYGKPKGDSFYRAVTQLAEEGRVFTPKCVAGEISKWRYYTSDMSIEKAASQSAHAQNALDHIVNHEHNTHLSDEKIAEAPQLIKGMEILDGVEHLLSKTAAYNDFRKDMGSIYHLMAAVISETKSLFSSDADGKKAFDEQMQNFYDYLFDPSEKVGVPRLTLSSKKRKSDSNTDEYLMKLRSIFQEFIQTYERRFLQGLKDKKMNLGSLFVQSSDNYLGEDGYFQNQWLKPYVNYLRRMATGLHEAILEHSGKKETVLHTIKINYANPTDADKRVVLLPLLLDPRRHIIILHLDYDIAQYVDLFKASFSLNRLNNYG